MHHSKLATIVIDVAPEKLAEATAFWRAALGREVREIEGANRRYLEFEGSFDKLTVLLQQTEDSPEVHLDIHSDDVEAETRRLETLGAIRKRQHPRWQVMTAPSGHAFCVVRDKPERLQDGNTFSED